MLSDLVTILKEFQADKGAVLEHESRITIEKKLGSEEVKKIALSKYISGTLSPSISEEKRMEIMDRLYEKDIKADLKIAFLSTGEPFKNYGQIDNVFNENKTVLAHKPGEVLLVDVWATWCFSCQNPMTHNQQMLEKNVNWKDRVRIVGVSVDDDKKMIKERVQDKKWHSITHLALLEQKGYHPLIKDFKIKKIPFVCLVDKFGKTNYFGDPTSINLQKRINELIEQESETVSKIEGEYSAKTLAEKTHESMEEEASKFIDSLSKERAQEHFKQIDLFSFTIQIKKIYEKDKYQHQHKIKAVVMSDNPIALEKVHSFLGDHPGAEVQIETVNYITIPNTKGVKCWECAETLKYPFYWLKWEEETKFGCRKCVEAPSDIQGHHFKYEKNSVLLTGQWSKLALKNLGANVQPPHPKDVANPHYFCCNSCNQAAPKQINKPRYICQGCKMAPSSEWDHIDVCANCIENVLKGKEQSIERMKPEGHQLSHPFLRVLYNTNGYQGF